MRAATPTDDRTARSPRGGGRLRLPGVPSGARPAVVVAAASFAIFTAVMLLAGTKFGDLRIYQLEGRAIVKRWDLYGQLPGVHGRATYPPFAAILFAPTAALPLSVLKALNFLVTLALLVWTSVTGCRMAGAPPETVWRAGLLLAALAVWCEPVQKTFAYGQINLVLLALVLWDFTRADDSRLRGIGVGLATAIKVTPGIFVLYLVLTRRWRAAATAVGTFAAAIALSAAVDHDATRRYWTHYLFDVHRVGRLENAVNQTIRGFLVRADHTRETRPTELIVVLIVLVVGMACAVLAYRLIGDSWGLPAAAITGLLVSPISWSHHWVWCVPVTALIWYQARRWILPTFVIFWSYAVWAIPHTNSAELHFTKVQIALSAWYILFGLTFLALTAVRVYRAATHKLVTAALGTVEPCSH